ncbi:MAG: MFS transporter [Desulfomonilaceae bacterium]|nr:MFS transporter [Desulfomonilaceae bacterium]
MTEGNGKSIRAGAPPKLYLDPNLQIMFGVTLMVLLGVLSVMPVLPELTVELGVPERSIGLVVSLFALPGVVLAPVAGILADRIGRKKVLVAALLIFGLFGTACGFAPDFETLLVLRLLQGVGMAPIGVLNATLIGDLYEGTERITAMGYVGTVLSIGTALLPAVGGALALLGWNYPFMLPVIAVPLALLVMFSLKNPEPHTTHAFKDYLRGALSVILTKRAIGLFSLTFLTFLLLYGPYVTYIPLLLQKKFGLSSVMVGLIVSVSSLFTGLASSQLGRLASMYRDVSILRASFFLFLTSMVLIPFVPGLWSFLVPLGIFGAAMGLGGPSRVTLLTGLAPANQRAAVMAANGMVQRFSQTVAPVLMGAILASFGMDAVFWTGAFIAICMLVVTIRAVE